MFQVSKLFCLATLAVSALAGTVQRRALDDDFTLIFDGTGLRSTDRDASVEGAGYLTFTLVNDIDECFTFCRGIDDCRFVNFYEEFNDPNSPNPATKCAAYNVIKTAADKTNFGGEDLDPALGLTFIQQSEGFARDI